jgi:hypothetical protein
MRWFCLGLGILLSSACGARSGVEDFEPGYAAPAGATVPSRASAGGASGVGGNANVDSCPTLRGDLIDDIEDGRTSKSIAPGLTLEWWPSYEPGAAIQIGSDKFTPRTGSRVTMHDRTDRASLGLGFRLSPCADISSARAVVFWARASASAWASVNIASQLDTPVSSGGWCFSTLCTPTVKWIELTKEWKRFELPFNSFTPPLQPNQLETFRSLELAVDIAPKSGPVELWMDDPALVR